MANYSAIKYNFNLPTGTTNESGNSLELIKTLTASNSADLTFVNGASSVVLDGTYKTYLFRFINIHPATDNVGFTFNGRDGGTAYDALKSTTVFEAGHDEAENYSATLAYDGDADIANDTGFQRLARNVSGDNDHSVNGELWLFNPSSTTFIKHFQGRTSHNDRNNFEYDSYTAGYFNVTAAIDAIQFKFASNNIGSGTIKLYGIR